METVIKVGGMKCGACSKAINEALKKMPSINEVLIDLENKTVTIASDTKIPEDIIKQKIENLGFDIL